MLLDLFVARRGLWIEAEPLVKIVRLVLAPAIPFQGIVREVERRCGFEIEHWATRNYRRLLPQILCRPSADFGGWKPPCRCRSKAIRINLGQRDTPFRHRFS